MTRNHLLRSIFHAALICLFAACLPSVIHAAPAAQKDAVQAEEKAQPSVQKTPRRQAEKAAAAPTAPKSESEAPNADKTAAEADPAKAAEAEARAVEEARIRAELEAEAAARAKEEARIRAEEEAKARAAEEAEAAARAKAAEEARAAEEAKAVQEAWDALLNTHNAQLAGIISHSKDLKDHLANIKRSTSQGLEALENEFQKLNALSQVNGSMPSDLTVLIERFVRIQERIKALISPLRNTVDMLEKDKNTLSVLETSLTSGAGGKNAAGKELADRLRNANSNTESLLVSYRDMVAPAEALIARVHGRIEQAMKDVPALWHSYYFEPSGHFYDIVAWGREIKNLGSLRELFTLRLTTEIPNGSSSWMVLLLRVFCVMAIFFIASQAVMQIARRKLPARMQSGISRVIRNSAIWIGLGIALHYSAWGDGKLYQMIATIGTMSLCWGQMLLAWDLYDIEKPARPKLSPLWPMFPSLIVGMVLLNFDPFPLFICVAWLIVQIVDLWLAHRRTPPADSLLGVIMRLYTVQLWITLFISLFGFARLAILASMCFTSAAVTVMLCVSIIRAESLMEKSIPSEGSSAVLSSLAMALIMPIILLLAVLAAVLWIIAYPGGFFLLQHIATMGFNIGDVSLNFIQIISILIAFYLTRALLAVGNTLMAGMEKQISRISVSLLAPIQIVYKCVLWSVFGLYALKALGFNLASLSMIAGGLSVGIGIGLQNMVQNFTSGISVIFGQTIREGDVVEVGGVLGVVKKINIRSTVLETYDNATIFVPNSSFLGGTFTNWTRNGRKVRKEIAVGVAYGSDVSKCLQMLLQIARQHPKVIAYPAPSAFFTDFGASSLDLMLRFWVREYNDAFSITSELRLKINEVFTENGIEIAFPQMDVHMRDDSTLALTRKAAAAESEPAAPASADIPSGQEA